MLASHEGLLQLLESHVKEIHNYNKENEELRDEIKSLKLRAAEVERNFRQMCEKYLALKKRRDLKVVDWLIRIFCAGSVVARLVTNFFIR